MNARSLTRHGLFCLFIVIFDFNLLWQLLYRIFFNKCPTFCSPLFWSYSTSSDYGQISFELWMLPNDSSFLNSQHTPEFIFLFIERSRWYCWSMDQGSFPIIYHCTGCNIWTVAKNYGQVTRCMRCSRFLKLIHVKSVFVLFCCGFFNSFTSLRNWLILLFVFLLQKREEKWKPWSGIKRN